MYKAVLTELDSLVLWYKSVSAEKMSKFLKNECMEVSVVCWEIN